MRSSRVFWGLVLVFGGVFFLANQSGLIRPDPGLLWPVLVIILGIFVLLGSTRLLADPKDQQQLSLPLESAVSASIKIDHGGGRLRISGAAGRNELLAGYFRQVEVNTQRSGDNVKLNLRSTIAGSFFWLFPWNWGEKRHDWDFALNPDIPISLNLDTGASECHLDLRQTKVTRLDLDTGASSTTVILPEAAGFTRFDADFGAASLNVVIPEGVSADIRIDSGLGSVNIDTNRFPQSGKHFRSGDYSTAKNKVEIDIDSGVSSLTIQ